MSGTSIARVVHTFFSVASPSALSSTCTRSCLDVKMTRYGLACVKTRIHPRIWAHWVAIRYQMPKATVGSRAKAPVPQCGCSDKCAGCGTFKTNFGTDIGDGQQSKEHFTYVPHTKRPMVPVHWIGKVAGFSTRQLVVQEALVFESKSTASVEFNGTRMRTGPVTSPRYDGSRSNWERPLCSSGCTSRCIQSLRSNTVTVISKTAHVRAPPKETRRA